MSVKNLVIGLCFLFQLSAHASDSEVVKDFIAGGAMKNLALKVVKRNMISTSSQTHTTAELVLHNKLLGEIRMYEKVPMVRTMGQLPTLFVLSGLQTGADAIFVAPEVPNMRILTFDYPVERTEDPAKRAGEVTKNIFRITGQIIATFMWLQQQSDVDPSQIYSLNISFGSFIAPGVLRALGDIGIRPARTIFAFGGSSLEPFLLANIEKFSPVNVDTESVKKHVARFSKEMNVTRHLKHLQGPFLVIRGTRDSVIPVESSQALIDNLPANQTTVVELDSDHINTDTPEIIDETFRVILDWL